MSSQKQKKQYALKKTAAVVIMGSLILTAALSVAAFTKPNESNIETEAQLAATDNNSEETVEYDAEASLSLSNAFDMTANEVSMIENQSEKAALGQGKEGSDVEINIQNWVKLEIDLRGKKITKDVPEGTVASALEYLDIKLAEFLEPEKVRKLTKSEKIDEKGWFS